MKMISITTAPIKSASHSNLSMSGEIYYLSISKVEQNLRYQGQYFDQETYNTFRYYDLHIDIKRRAEGIKNIVHIAIGK